MKPRITKDQLDQAWETIRQYNSENNTDVYRAYYDECLMALGTTKEILQGGYRKRELVYRRIIVANALRNKFIMITVETIAEIMGKDHSSISYYFKREPFLEEYPDFMHIKNKLPTND